MTTVRNGIRISKLTCIKNNKPLIDEKTKVLMRYSHCQQQKEKYVTLKEVDSNGQSLKVLLAYELTGGGLPQDEAQTAFLKHLIQRTDVKERKLYSTTFEQHQRYAAFCATTNSLVPLKDETGSRRYMVVEVTDIIDTDTTGKKTIDYRQLYAQIVSEIASGEEYAFTGERERRIQEQNSDYYELPNVVGIFQDHYRLPQAGDEVLWLTPTKILEQIKDELKINIVTQSNATLLGSHLAHSGFQKGKGDLRRCYAVARKP